MIIKHLLAHKSKAINVSLVYTVLLTFYCLKQSPIPIELPSQSDKILHALAYFVFTIVWFLAFYFTLKLSRTKSFIYTFLFSVAFGVLIEILQQQLTTYREGDVLDVVANTFGTILALLLLKIIFKRPLNV